MVKKIMPSKSAKEKKLISDLNDDQRRAVLHKSGPLLVLAGAGSGKTRVITYRIARLIGEQGIAPDAVLAITFTNKAAQEMAGRLINLLDADRAGQVVIKTFHAFGAMLLREAGEQLGLPSNIAICSEQERQSLLKQRYPEWSRRDTNRHLDDISTAKSQLLTPDTVEPSLAEIYQTYQQGFYPMFLYRLTF